jgi:hypothetical protein
MAGDFFWLIGKVLGAVDAGFDYDRQVYAAAYEHDESRNVFIQDQVNDKNPRERNRITIVETPFQDWNESVGRENFRELRSMNDDPYDGYGPGGFFW